jgi:hypothetical protein
MTLPTILIKLIRAPFIVAAYFYVTFKQLYLRFKGRKAQLDRAIKKADKLHKDNGKRYRVFFLDGKYRVFQRAEIKENRKAGVFNRYINSTKMDHLKFYDTNDILCTSQQKN